MSSDIPAAPEGTTDRGRAHGTFERRRRRLTWVLAAVYVAMIAVHALLFETFTVPSASMEPGLGIGDRIVVNKQSPIRRGSVIVFNGEGSMYQAEPPQGMKAALDATLGALGFRIGQTDYVKRVIGVGGDKVSVDHRGILRVNDHVVKEPYLAADTKASLYPFSIRVPAGKYFVMGDNRTQSDDSRNHLGEPGGGMVPADKVIGVVSARYWMGS